MKHIVLLSHTIGQTFPAVLISRMEKCLEIYNAGDKIIISGKCGLTEQKETSDASLIKDCLVKHGAKAEDVILEDNSVDTITNAIYLFRILKNVKEFSLITNKFHMSRVKYVFRKFYGRDRLMNFVECDDRITGDEFQTRKKQEFNLMSLTKEWLDWIKYGESYKFFSHIKMVHPYYNKQVSAQVLYNKTTNIKP